MNRNLYYAVIIGALLSGCAHTGGITTYETSDTGVDVQYTVIYYIHGDADYLYHTDDGSSVQADKEVLATAINIAEQATSGEVFIVHQRPQRRFLGLFPQATSRLFYYRNGEKISEGTYRNDDEAFLLKEARLYKTYKSNFLDKKIPSYFLYFGHEIPVTNGNHYHHSLPDVPVHTESFVNGLQHFLPDQDDRFSLVVLSTCNNGTPVMVKHLMPWAQYLLASPQNLHLSAINSTGLTLLEQNPVIPPINVAERMADQTYNRLTESIYTTITLSVYDVDVTRGYIDQLYTQNIAYEALGSPKSVDNIDCVKHPYFDPHQYIQGVKSWYQPARFGRKNVSMSPSGWGCKDLVINDEHL